MTILWRDPEPRETPPHSCSVRFALQEQQLQAAHRLADELDEVSGYPELFKSVLHGSPTHRKEAASLRAALLFHTATCELCRSL